MLPYSKHPFLVSNAESQRKLKSPLASSFLNLESPAAMPQDLSEQKLRNLHERRDAVQIFDCLRRRFDRGNVAVIERGMNLVDALGPDATAAALGQLDEVGAAGIQRAAVRLVLHEQTLDGFTRGSAIDTFADGNP